MRQNALSEGHSHQTSVEGRHTLSFALRRTDSMQLVSAGRPKQMTLNYRNIPWTPALPSMAPLMSRAGGGRGCGGGGARVPLGR